MVGFRKNCSDCSRGSRVEICDMITIQGVRRELMSISIIFISFLYFSSELSSASGKA
jgi:hypothetical protein